MLIDAARVLVGDCTGDSAVDEVEVEVEVADTTFVAAGDCNATETLLVRAISDADGKPSPIAFVAITLNV